MPGARRRLDPLSPAERSRRMAMVRSKDTKPEMRVRRLVHSLGYRYRLHGRGLPGRPDMVFASRRKVIFVHGCFWHRHQGCAGCRLPKTRVAFWKAKLEENRRRDVRSKSRLRRLGWGVQVIWECQTESPERLKKRVVRFLGARK